MPRRPVPILRSHAGFTLVEVMIGASIGSFVLLGILTAFVTLGRSGARLANYNTMETESRRTLDEFSQDIRMASDTLWNSSSSLTLTVPENYASNGNQVTYAYDSAARSFYRLPGTSASSATKTILCRNVSSCVFKRWQRTATPTAATTDAETKRIELTLKISVTTATTVATTENAVSATYLIRNKLAN